MSKAQLFTQFKVYGRIDKLIINRKEKIMSKVIKLGNYKGIEVSVKKTPVTDEEVEAQIQQMVAQSTSLEEKEGDVAVGDVTTIDFEGFKDGVAFEGGKAEGFQLEIGSGQFIPGFEEQMVGMKKGETRELNLTFPENYQAEDLAGADVIFKVTLHQISTKKQAELNDEFVATFNNPEMKTVEDLRKMMRMSLEGQRAQEFKTTTENEILGKLIEESEVEVDEEDIQKALTMQIQQMSMEIARQGMQLEQYLQMFGMTMEALEEQMKPSAKQQAEFEAIIDELIHVENINTTDEEVDQQIEQIATMNQMSKEDVLKQLGDADLKKDLNRVKASQLVLTSAIVNEG